VHSKNCWQNKQNIPKKICHYSSLHLVADKNTDFVSVWNKLFKENTCIPEHEFMCKKLNNTRGTWCPKTVVSLIGRHDMTGASSVFLLFEQRFERVLLFTLYIVITYYYIHTSNVTLD